MRWASVVGAPGYMLVVREAVVVVAAKAVQHCCRHNSSLRFPHLILSMAVLVMGR